MDVHELPWHRDPEIMGGRAVFIGTRVPVTCLVDNLVEGMDLEGFLENYPTITREQAVAALDALTEYADSGPLSSTDTTRAA